jgi:NAD(P)-dependent dehydrogenase (short-subunit alcohol dehydrogenase family)
MLKTGGGAIVNTASASGVIGGYNLACYTATKHAVVGLTKAAAMDYATQGIRINAVCPGLVDTPFISGLPQQAIDRLMLATPIARPAQPEEIAQAVMWLCSDAASYMLGHPLSVDGGVALGGTGTQFADLFPQE